MGVRAKAMLDCEMQDGDSGRALTQVVSVLCHETVEPSVQAWHGLISSFCYCGVPSSMACDAEYVVQAQDNDSFIQAIA
jgi:hypothetical protein